MRPGAVEDVDKLKAFDLEVTKKGKIDSAVLVQEFVFSSKAKLLDMFKNKLAARDLVFLIEGFVEVATHFQYINFLEESGVQRSYDGFHLLMENISFDFDEDVKDVLDEDKISLLEVMEAMTDVIKKKKNPRFNKFDAFIEKWKPIAVLAGDETMDRIAEFKRVNRIVLPSVEEQLSNLKQEYEEYKRNAVKQIKAMRQEDLRQLREARERDHQKLVKAKERCIDHEAQHRTSRAKYRTLKRKVAAEKQQQRMYAPEWVRLRLDKNGKSRGYCKNKYRLPASISQQLERSR